MTGLLFEARIAGGARPPVAADRAAAFGDGMFETMLLHRGQSPFMALHRCRLSGAAQRLGLSLPASLWSSLEHHFQSLQDVPFALAKLSVSRQSVGRGYAPASSLCHIHLSVYKAEAPWRHRAWREGAYLELSKFRLAMDAQLAGIKHLNRLPQVLASAALGQADEHLMQDTSGCLIEGTKSNVILVNRTAGHKIAFELISPKLDQAGVDGVAKQALRTAIDDGCLGGDLSWRECKVTPAMLAAAEEVLVCNSVIGIWAARRIGCMHKGDAIVCRRLQDYWQSRVEGQVI